MTTRGASLHATPRAYGGFASRHALTATRVPARSCRARADPFRGGHHHACVHRVDPGRPGVRGRAVRQHPGRVRPPPLGEEQRRPRAREDAAAQVSAEAGGDIGPASPTAGGSRCWTPCSSRMATICTCGTRTEPGTRTGAGWATPWGTCQTPPLFSRGALAREFWKRVTRNTADADERRENTTRRRVFPAFCFLFSKKKFSAAPALTFSGSSPRTPALVRAAQRGARTRGSGSSAGEAADPARGALAGRDFSPSRLSRGSRWRIWIQTYVRGFVARVRPRAQSGPTRSRRNT